MRNLVMYVFVTALVILPAAVFGMTAPTLPPSAFVDTEVSTNIVLVQPAANVSGLNLQLLFSGTSSNNVEIALGMDADNDGELSFDEMDIRLGWDCGRYFVERVSTGERYEETNVGTNNLNRVFDWQCVVYRNSLKSLAVSTEAGVGFTNVTANPPAWLYGRNWNLINLTARGTDVQNEQFIYEATQRGAVFILQ